jgi:hypothetical protein
MNRTKDYIGFAVRFAGLGYIVLWPLSSPDGSGKLFGASLVCRDGAFALMDLLCHLPHPLRLSPALHAVGFLSALFVIARLLLWAIRRVRRPAGGVAVDASVLAAHIPALRRPRRRKPLGPLRPIKPRANFGLRGVPH